MSEQNTTGQTGEKIVYDFLLQNKYEVERMTTREQQQYGDFLAKRNNTKMYIEVKTESYFTGNIFLEFLAETNKDWNGYLGESKADFLFYVNLGNNNLYIIEWRKFRPWLIDNNILNACDIRAQKASPTDRTAGFLFKLEYLTKYEFDGFYKIINLAERRKL